ncbi:MAG: PAS domain S-box protein [Proteobacteria bacterium]|nr:PAS domain S-box protein [Pseudomonadota bacterium]
MKILIAEDDLTTRTILTELLKKQGHEVVATANGMEAWAAIQQPNAPRLAILDWMMPEMDGIELCRRIRTLETDQPPYIIMLTVKDEKVNIVAGLEAGADDYLTKPYNPGELRARINVGRHMLELQIAMGDKVRQLRESEARYRVAIEGSSDGVAIVKDLAHVYVNERFLRMFGYEHVEEILGKPPYFNVHPDDLKRVKSYAIMRVQGKDVPEQYEFRGIRKNGTSIDIEVSVNAITYEGERAILAYLRDVTERKQMTEELKKSELRYRSLIESSPDAIILHDGERILYSNPAALRHFGLGETKKLIGRKILDFIHPEDREAVADSIGSTRETENVTPMARMKLVRDDGEFVKLVRDDGEFVYVECTSSTVDYGVCKLFLMNMRDMTLRLQTEAALDRIRLQQKAILDNIPDIAWLKDKESRFILANEPFGKACGVRPEDLPGKTDLDIWPGALAEKYRADDREAMQSGTRRQIEETLTDKEGHTIWIETTKTAIRHDSGEVIGTVGIARDITARKRQEEELLRYREELERLVDERTVELTKVNALLQQELSEHKLTEEKVQGLNRELEQRVSELNITNKELETFNYSVSHDLRTPLIAMEGFSRILMERHGHHLDEKGQRLLGMINRNTKRMGELIEDLLAFFSLGRKNIKFTTIDMEKITNDIITDFKTIFPNDTFHFGLDQLPQAYGDKKMVRQVLINLMGNAIKYSRPKGSAAIRVGGWMEEEKNTYYVKDNGIGFSMEHAGRIFEVFERLHSSDEIEGTGVGLAIVKRVVLKHGGGVWAEAKADEGATFYFSLPGRS